jgi:hypothetical protein
LGDRIVPGNEGNDAREAGPGRSERQRPEELTEDELEELAVKAVEETRTELAEEERRQQRRR